MSKNLEDALSRALEEIKRDGLYKGERVITSPQNAEINVKQSERVLNFCANNYLGLADHPYLQKAAHQAIDQYGFGMASVRFICGTLDIHKTLERRLAKWLKKDDAILYSSCFDANTGLFETLLGEGDAIISDALNHASIIDGVRLCKAERFRYKNSDMKDLERCLKESQNARHRLIATDGVFSMDGYLAKLPEICDLADQYDALVMVDDSHAIGFMGDSGAGTPEHFAVESRVDIVTGTLGKALGGASGGYTAAKQPVIDILRQRSRPYLFSNTLAPVITATSNAVLDLLENEGGKLRQKLKQNAEFFRSEMTKNGFDLLPGQHPIIPVMIYDAGKAAEFSDLMLKEGVYVVSFSYPVVPRGQARIRVQMSAAHTREHLEHAIAAFVKVGRRLNLIPKECA